MYSAVYTIGDAQYNVTDSKEVHSRLQSDANFLSQYLANATTAPELVSVLDETFDSTCIDSEKKNSFSWTKQATQLFLNSYLDRKDSFRNPKVKKKSLWIEILQIMKANGYTNLNEDLLDRKMRNMKKSYKNIKDNNKKSSTGRGRVLWEYFETFEDIFANDMTINCCSTFSSMQRDKEITANESFQEDYEVTALTNLFSDSSNNSSILTSLSTSSISPFQPIHLPSPSSSSSIPGSTSDVPSPLPNVSPSVLTEKSERSEKSTRMSSLYNIRKRQLDIEERRIKAIMELKTPIDSSNKIQQERNDLLRNLLLKTNQGKEKENI